MQPTGGMVHFIAEFPACVQGSKDNLERRDFGVFGVRIDGNAAPVITDDEGVVRLKLHLDEGGMAGYSFIHCIIEHLIDEVMHGGFIVTANIHAGAAAYGLEPLEYLDILCRIALCLFPHFGGRFGKQVAHIPSETGLHYRNYSGERKGLCGVNPHIYSDGIHENVTDIWLDPWHRRRMQSIQHSAETHSRLEHAATLGLRGFAVGSAAISLTPFIFGQTGFGAIALQLTQGYCSSGPGSGLAGMTYDAASHIPLIGSYLASGGILNGVLALGIGLGGLAIGRYLERHDHPTAAKIVRWGSIATSLLVSLPALLPALGMGFHFISIMTDGTVSEFATKAFEALGKLGSASAASAYAQSGSTLLASAGHLLTCGLAVGSTALIAESTVRAIRPHTIITAPTQMSRVTQPELMRLQPV